MSYKVFISSTRDDLELAKDVARRLEEVGVAVFPVEQTAIEGGKFLTKVNRNLRKADEVLLILTKDSGNSPGLLSEMGMAFSMDKPITPVMVSVDVKSLSPIFKSMRHVKFSDLNSHIAKLTTRLKEKKTATKTRKAG